jgi:putative aldouronate transport system substrate-binding protein
MKKLMIVLFVVAIAVPAFTMGAKGAATGGPREYDIFLGYPKNDYPSEGTILGDWIEEQTGVHINWEFIVGDLEQKIGLIAASGDYPDAIHPRNETHILMGANALIPMTDLIASNGPNIAALYGDRIEMIKQPDGEVYWLPQIMPYGDEYRNPKPGHGVWVQQRVLEEWGYEYPTNLEDFVEKLIDYAKDHPETNDNDTLAWTGVYDTWRWFSISNIPHILSGHPNDGSINVDLVRGKWVASSYHATKDEYNSYRILNKVYLAGLFDTEAFVMSYDQYIAKLSAGATLAFYDQDWQFQTAQSLLLDQNEGTWYVALPVMLEGYEPNILNPPQPQVSEGIGISVDCDDPEGLMDYFNFLASREALLMRHWGREGEEYMVGSDGVFYKTQEQIEKWRNLEWQRWTYGKEYWTNFLQIDSSSVIWDGLNNANPDYQPSIYRQVLRPQEVANLDALGADTEASIFPPADLRRSVYFPAWTINLPADSQEFITNQRMEDVRRKWIPLLIMAEEGEYNAVWEDYLAEYNAIPQADRDAWRQYIQNEIDRRVAAAGGN